MSAIALPISKPPMISSDAPTVAEIRAMIVTQKLMMQILGAPSNFSDISDLS